MPAIVNVFIRQLICGVLRKKIPNTAFFGLYFSAFGMNGCLPYKFSYLDQEQGYAQKQKLFRSNSFVLAHLSAKKIYND